MFTSFKGYEIRKSGNLFKVCKGGKRVYSVRYISIDAAKCAILASNPSRTYTRREYSIVYGEPMKDEPTPQQAQSEKMVISGNVEGFI